MTSRLLQHLRGVALFLLLGFQTIATLSANDQATLPSPRQSLLFEVRFEAGIETGFENNRADLRLLRRIMPGLEPESGRTINADTANGLIAPTIFQDSKFSGIPHAQWLDSDGRVLAITSFDEPRILRSPQNGQRTHGAIVAQRTSHFLLRGPGNAVTVNLYLPSLNMQAAQVLPFNTPRLDTNAGANRPSSTNSLQSVAQPQQSWRIDLSL